MSMAAPGLRQSPWHTPGRQTFRKQLQAKVKRLGAQLGITAILHTWGQNLLFHPHLHCVVTGGGLSPDGSRWIATRPGYLLPVKVLARLFRGKFLAGVKEAYDAGQLSLAPLSGTRRHSRWSSSSSTTSCRFSSPASGSVTERRTSTNTQPATRW
jgi:hypothetical protein